MTRITNKLCLPLLIFMLACSCSSKRKMVETTSPTGKLKFHFEQVRRGGISLFPQGQDVYYTFYADNNVVFENRLFLEDEFKYRSFEEIFPDLRWVADNILRMGSKEDLLAALHDEVKISNDTEKTVILGTVRISPYETFLIANIQPHQTIKIDVHSQADQDYSWVEAEVEFQSGGRVSGGNNFKVLQQQIGIAHYCLSIREKTIAPSSQEFDGIETLLDGKQKITPKGCPPQ